MLTKRYKNSNTSAAEALHLMISKMLKLNVSALTSSLLQCRRCSAWRERKRSSQEWWLGIWHRDLRWPGYGRHRIWIAWSLAEGLKRRSQTDLRSVRNKREMRTSPFWLKMKNAFDVSGSSQLSTWHQTTPWELTEIILSPTVYLCYRWALCIYILTATVDL